VIKIQEHALNDNDLPLVWEAVQGKDASIDTVADWLTEHRQALEAAMVTYGAVLLRGFEAIDSAQGFGKVLDVVAPELMDYLGGTAPRHTVHGRILTATDLPSNFTLALHQEMAYTANPPDAVAFFCQLAPTSGGETTVADARQVTERIDPAVRARFADKGVRVRRTLPDPESLSKRPGIPKPWQDVFETKDRAEVQRVADAKGWRIRWLDDGSLQLWQEALPAFKSHPRTGERVWFNQAHYHSPECTLRWAQRDQRLDQIALIETAMREHPEMLDNALHLDDTPISAADAHHIWDVLEQAEIPIPWQTGDVLLLDNVLAMHGRRSFRGARSILAALIRNPAPNAVAADQAAA